LGLLRGGGEEEEGEDEVVVVEEEEEEEEEGRTHFRRLRCPEIRLMALVVIATKLLFPWDGRPRFPQSATDLSALEMDWTEWARVQRAGRRLSGRSAETTASDGPLRFEDAFNMTEEQSLALADERLDEYLDWYQSNLASDEVRQRGRAGKDAGFRKALFSMFPVPDLHAEKKRTPMRTPVSAQTTQTQTEQTQQTQQTQQSSPSGRPRAAPEITSTSGTTSAAEGVARVQAALRPRRIVAAVESREPDHVPRFGSSYVQYRTVEELLLLRSGGDDDDDDDDDDDEENEGEDHGTTAMLFYEMAAELAGCELHSLVRAVFVMERRFMRLEHYLRRERRGGS
jgi:RNA polymerase I-specific transcription initiation factor RRN7